MTCHFISDGQNAFGDLLARADKLEAFIRDLEAKCEQAIESMPPPLWQATTPAEFMRNGKRLAFAEVVEWIAEFRERQG